MATVHLSLDQRRPLKSGLYPIRLSVHHHGTFRLATGYSATPETWSAAGLTRAAPNSKARNAALHRMLHDAESTLIRLEEEGRLRSMSDAALKDAVERAIGHEPPERSFIACLEEYIGRLTNQGTRTVYTTTRNKLLAYDPHCTFSSMDRRWLEAFDTHMAATMKMNARAIHLRNIRAVFNYALDMEYTTLYPFRRYRIRQEATRKRSLTVDELRMLRDYPCEPYQVQYRDMFLLMFFLIGINAADLFRARPDQLRHGRLEYRRAKTGRLYSVKVLPEAMAIIDRYRGRDYLLNVCDTYADYRDYLHRMNNALKQIGSVERVGRGGKKVRQPLFPDLSSYWARHSWATMAANLGIPTDVISEALGHQHGSPVTAIYVKYDGASVDKANEEIGLFFLGTREAPTKIQPATV